MIRLITLFFLVLHLGLSQWSVAAPAAPKKCPWLAETYLGKSVISKIDPSDRLALEITFRRAFEHPSERLSEIEMGYVKLFDLESAVELTKSEGRKLLKKQRNSKLITGGSVITGVGVLAAFLYPALNRHFIEIFNIEGGINSHYGLKLSHNKREELQLLESVLKASNKEGRDAFNSDPKIKNAKSVEDVVLHLYFENAKKSNLARMSSQEKHQKFLEIEKLWKEDGIRFGTDWSDAKHAVYQPQTISEINKTLNSLSPTLRQFLKVNWVMVQPLSKSSETGELSFYNQSTGTLTMEYPDIYSFRESLVQGISNSPAAMLLGGALQAQFGSEDRLPEPYDKASSSDPQNLIYSSLSCILDPNCNEALRKSNPQLQKKINELLLKQDPDPQPKR